MAFYTAYMDYPIFPLMLFNSLLMQTLRRPRTRKSKKILTEVLHFQTQIMHKSVRCGLVHFLLLDNFLHCVVGHDIHKDLDFVGIYQNLIYVLIYH